MSIILNNFNLQGVDNNLTSTKKKKNKNKQELQDSKEFNTDDEETADEEQPNIKKSFFSEHKIPIIIGVSTVGLGGLAVGAYYAFKSNTPETIKPFKITKINPNIPGSNKKIYVEKVKKCINEFIIKNIDGQTKEINNITNEEIKKMEKENTSPDEIKSILNILNNSIKSLQHIILQISNNIKDNNELKSLQNKLNKNKDETLNKIKKYKYKNIGNLLGIINDLYDNINQNIQDIIDDKPIETSP